MLNYEIIASGSSGNCVIIENVMFECGVSYNQIRNKLYDIDYLIITHIHSDHLKETTYNRIRKNFPNITTIGNYQVSQKLNGDLDYVVDIGVENHVGDFVFDVFEAVHDVVNCGYCWSAKGLDIIYCTDAIDYEYAPDRKYDYLFLESNHDEDKLNAIKKNSIKRYGYNAYEHGKRHCSTQRCKAFYYEHRRNKDSELIELHKSQRFY